MGNMGWKIAEAVLNLVAIGWERDAILAKIKVAQSNGMGPGELVKYLRQMRMDAVDQAEAAIEEAAANDNQPSAGGTD